MTQTTDAFATWSIEYCRKHKVPIWNEAQLEGYIKTSKILLREAGERMSDIQNFIHYPKLLADEKKHPKGTDEKETEPQNPVL